MEQGYGGVYSCSLEDWLLNLTLGPVLHYALSAASLRGTAKGVSVVYLYAIKTGCLFIVARCGCQRSTREFEQWKEEEEGCTRVGYVLLS